MAIHLGRRQFISALGGASLAWPLAARAQQRPKVPLLGYLTGDSDSADLPRRKAFTEGLRTLGYSEGQTIVIEYRTAAGSAEKLATFAAEFSHLNVDVIFAFTAGATQAAAMAMPTKPIVSITPDPVSAGFVASLAHPGGNITGLSTLAGTEMYSKYLEFLKDIVPNLTRVAVLSNPTFTTSALAVKAMQASAPLLGMSLQNSPHRGHALLAADEAAIVSGIANIINRAPRIILGLRGCTDRFRRGAPNALRAPPVINKT